MKRQPNIYIDNGSVSFLEKTCRSLSKQSAKVSHKYVALLRHHWLQLICSNKQQLKLTFNYNSRFLKIQAPLYLKLNIHSIICTNSMYWYYNYRREKMFCRNFNFQVLFIYSENCKPPQQLHIGSCINFKATA